MNIVMGFPKVYWYTNQMSYVNNLVRGKGENVKTYLATFLVIEGALQEVDSLVIQIYVSEAFKMD